MKFPHISYIYRKMAEMISTMDDKAYAISVDTVKDIGERSNQEEWTLHQRTGVLANDSADINDGIEHDYVTHELVGGDESHCLENLTHMFQILAQQ